MDDRSLSSCKRAVEEMGATMEVENIREGVKTRDMAEVSSKRRRSNSSTGLHSENMPESNLNLMNSSSPENSTTSSVNTVVHKQASDVVINGLRSTDLKLEDSETESSTFTNIAEFRETSTASSELCRGHSVDLMESSSTKSKPSPKDSRPKVSAGKMPSETEMDDFFATVEREQQKRFIEKYNYDIVKDVPLGGRYEWVRLKP